MIISFLRKIKAKIKLLKYEGDPFNEEVDLSKDKKKYDWMPKNVKNHIPSIRSGKKHNDSTIIKNERFEERNKRKND